MAPPHRPHLSHHPVSLCGRVLTKRAQGSKMLFYDLYADGAKVQVMSQLQYMEGGQEAFDRVHAVLRRGDVVGVVGRPGRSKKGARTRMHAPGPHPRVPQAS